MNLTQALQKLFGTSTITQGFGVLDVNGAPHNGVDIGLPANAPVYAAASGTVVANQGAQIAIQSAKGVIESYLHIVQADLPIGTYVNQRQQIGTVPRKRVYRIRLVQAMDPPYRAGRKPCRIGLPGRTCILL